VIGDYISEATIRLEALGIDLPLPAVYAGTAIQ